MQTLVSNPQGACRGVICMRTNSSSPVLTFEKVLRAYGTGGFTYTEVVAQLERLLAESHVISIHLLLNDETRGLVSREKIAGMRKGVILVNTARGAIVDEAAMIDALKSGHIRHAGLDVYNIEPMPKDHPLTKISNVTLSAHSAFRTPEASENLIHAAWEHCRRIVKS